MLQTSIAKFGREGSMCLNELLRGIRDIDTTHVAYGMLIMGCIMSPAYLYSNSGMYIKRLIAVLIGSVIGIYLGWRIWRGKEWFVSFRALSIIISIGGITEACVYLESWLTSAISHDSLNIYGTAHFDNIAGYVACLCCCVPFAMSLIDKKGIVSLIGVVAISVMSISLVLTSNRTGILCLVILLCIFVQTRFPHLLKDSWIYLLISLACGGLLVLLYFLKQDSADGRILIWKCVMKMLPDVPFQGFGLWGFRKRYMDYQAEFLELNQDDPLSHLADNVYSPFNEYLHLYINFGWVGVGIVCLLIYLFILGYRRSESKNKKVALMAMVFVGVLAIFSYPFRYPLTYVVVLASFAIVWRDKIQLLLIKRFRSIMAVGLCSLCLVSFCKCFVDLQSLRRWHTASVHSNLSAYEDIYQKLQDNPFFLYNYSSRLLENGKIDKSMEVALNCKALLANYDLELLLGDIYKEKKDFDRAARHYCQAANMCPCRFVPQYQLFELYGLTENESKRKEIAEEILAKPIKIKSKSVSMIRLRVREYLKEFNNQKQVAYEVND